MTTDNVPVRLFSTTNVAAASFWQGGINSVLVTEPLTDLVAALLTTYLKAPGGIA